MQENIEKQNYMNKLEFYAMYIIDKYTKIL
jgi:hypothetical protein